MPRSFIKTNSQALRWCQTRRAVVQFNNWKDIVQPSAVADELPSGVSCRVALGDSCKFGKTLTKAVNQWIQSFNKQKEK